MSSSAPSTSRIRYIVAPEPCSLLVLRHVRGSFTERRLDAEPHGPDEPGYDHRDDCLEGVALHPSEDDQTVPGRFDLVGEQLEPAADSERGDLALDQPLRGLRQR